MAWNLPAGGPKMPLRRFSNLPSSVSCVMLADLRCVDSVATRPRLPHETRRRSRGRLDGVTVASRRVDAVDAKLKLRNSRKMTLSQHVWAENVIVSGINSAGALLPSHLLTPCRYWEMFTVLPVPVSPTIMQ